MRLIVLIMAALILSGLNAQAERIALVIGNATYENAPDLEQTRNDAEAMAAKLSSLGFRLVGDKAHTDLTRAQMLRQIRAFGQTVSEGDEAVFYFSGHGIGGTQTNYLLPTDDSDIEAKEDVADFAIDVAGILNRLPTTGGGVNVFILDACRNNPLPNRDKTAFAEKGLSRVSGNLANTIFLYAAEPGEKAYVSDSGKSYFTEAVLREMSVPGLNLTDIIRRVRNDVANLTSSKLPPQRPWQEGLTSQPFFFNRASGLQCGGLYSAAGVEALWRSVQASSDPIKLDEFAQTCSDTQFAPAATQLATTLRSTPVPISSSTRPRVSEPAPTPTTSHRAGEAFRDTLVSGGTGPEMTVLPSVSFMMGSPASETGRDNDEGPQRRVTIDYKFAVGTYEVSWSEWEACVSAGGCEDNSNKKYSDTADDKYAGDAGYGRGSRPVINVSWDDARAYATWLSGETDATYRLLSESEWEYAARARSTGPYPWGPSIGRNKANCTGDQCSDQYDKTAPVGSFPANSFGLHDMHGNVNEWVEDWYKSGYSHALSDGTSFTNCSDCSTRVVRGGSWGGNPRDLRSANRGRGAPVYRNNGIGFRVARTLPD